MSKCSPIMTKILMILQLVFVILVILPGLNAAENEIKCYYCDKQCESPLNKKIACNDSFSGLFNADNKQTRLDDDPFVCYSVEDSEPNKEHVFKGCGVRSSVLYICQTTKAKKCPICLSDYCNAAGLIKFSLAMILIPIAVVIFNKS